MTRLPRISGRNCVSALQKAGFKIKRQHGSHIILRRDEPFTQVVVPDHKELDTGNCAQFCVKPAYPQKSFKSYCDLIREALLRLHALLEAREACSRS